MAGLNDKLITYGNLSTFKDKLQEQGCIVDASVLPDAGENKSKFIRLTSDDNVYVSELKSRTSTTTNRLPDEQQIDKAYLYKDGIIYYYGGSVRVILGDGELNWFKWYDNLEEPTYLYITETNAENIDNTKLEVGVEIDVDGWGYSNGVITNSELSVSDVLDSYALSIEDNSMYAIPATYNAPESAQIGNATINDGDNYYYTGREITLVVSDGEFKGYGWEYEGDGYCTYLTDKKASDIYYASSGHVSDVGVLNIFNIDDFENWIISGDTYTNLNMSLDDIGYGSISDIGYINIPQLNAPDSEQVGNAYITSNNNYYTYNGESVNVLLFNPSTQRYDTPATMHLWQNPNYENAFGTEVTASNLYSKSQIAYCAYIEDGDNSHWEGNYDLDAFQLNPTLSTVKYQRTEVTEKWEWKKVITEDELTSLEARIYALEHPNS